MLLIIRPDASLISIYTDGIPYATLGRPSVERASHVEYDNGQQGWTVTFPDGLALPEVFTTRGAALRAEVMAVERRLKGATC